MNTYKFRGGIIRQTTTMEFADRLELDEQDLELRGNFSAYLRGIGRQLRNEFYESTR